MRYTVEKLHTDNNKNNFKSYQRKKNILPQWNDRLRAHFSAAAIEVRRQWSNIFKKLRKNNCLDFYIQPNHQLRMIKIFFRHIKARKFTTIGKSFKRVHTRFGHQEEKWTQKGPTGHKKQVTTKAAIMLTIYHFKRSCLKVEKVKIQKLKISKMNKGMFRR